MLELSDLELDDLRHFHDYPELAQCVNHKVKHISKEDSVLNTTELDTAIEGAKIKFMPMEHVANGLIVHTVGEINTFNSSKFQSAVKKAIAAGYHNLIFNCKDISYLSSTGVGSFTFILKDVGAVHGQMAICEMRSKVYEVFSLLGFNKFFPMFDSLSEATESFNPTIVKKQMFPAVCECPICSKKYKVGKTGRYRCASCRTVFSINEQGKSSI